VYTYRVTGNVKKYVLVVLSHLEDVSRGTASCHHLCQVIKSDLTIIMQNVSLFEKS